MDSQFAKSLKKLSDEEPAFGTFGQTYIIEGPGLPGMTSRLVAFNNMRGALLQSKLALEVALGGARRHGLERSVELIETVLVSVNSAISEIETDGKDG